MLMIARVLECDREQVRCTSCIEADNPLLVNGLFPSYGTIELLAQAAGILLGVREGLEGHTRPGAIAQIKRFSTTGQDISVGSQLEIEANYSGGNATVAMFTGRVILEHQSLLNASLMIALLPEVG